VSTEPLTHMTAAEIIAELRKIDPSTKLGCVRLRKLSAHTHYLELSFGSGAVGTRVNLKKQRKPA
jgi:hypothetical protein